MNAFTKSIDTLQRLSQQWARGLPLQVLSFNNLALLLESIHVYVMLCCFFFLYSTRVKGAVDVANNSPRTASHKKWESTLNDAISLSHSALGVGFFCICIGAYITQNSYESQPAMLGVILMLTGIDTLVNAFTIFLYIKLVAKHTRINNLEVDKEDFVRQTAKVLAVPASSMTWCFLVAFVAVIVYFGQPAAPQVNLEPYFNGQGITMDSRSRTSTSAHPSTTNTSSGSIPFLIAAHTFSFIEKSCIGAAAILCAMRFLFVLYSVLRLRSLDEQTLELQNIDTSSTHDGSALPSPQ